MSAEDFDPLKVIGRGAFGEVEENETLSGKLFSFAVEGSSGPKT